MTVSTSAERTAEAVEAPHDERFSRARVLERALGERPTCPIANDPFAAGGLEGVLLERGLMVERRDAASR